MGRRLILRLATPALCLLGCQTQEEPTAWVRFVHVNPEYAATVDVWAGKKPAFVGVTYGDATSYATFLTQSSFQAFPEGRRAPALFAISPRMEAERKYSLLFLFGVPNQALVLPDDTTAPPSGQAYVRFVHAALGVGRLLVTDAPLRGGGGQPRLESPQELLITLRQAGHVTGYRAFQAGDVVLYLSPDGVRSTVSARLSLRSGSLYTVVITGSGNLQHGLPLRFRSYEHLLIP
ncbi:MAG: DUF4397 domain-containing protein [Bacteroidetes bacterium]|nr:DUF4397 domain-containing protein [Rhodothermia bacterium]MCS7154276.1 DUF4397 domain-containing protein [Bacteroidota bacterium]MCX7906688.1 DUF4397 domain-containing protein [Bacteroidota bacterium]MDW8137032.1 DUF4397 domain-containing protein [Bacteroidota bacterium]MDW8285097.1 DUF4397 domain-containing protein [Bacteroidota bacterium]